MAPRIVFGLGHEKAPLCSATIAAQCRNAFDESRALSRFDRRDDDPIARMIKPKLAGILRARLARTEDNVIGDFIGMGFAVAQSLVGAFSLIVGEETRKRRRDLRPFRIFFVVAPGVSIGRMNEGVALFVEVQTAMRGGGMEDDALAVRPRNLRRSPWRDGACFDFSAIEREQLALVTGDFCDMSAKSRFIFEETLDHIKIRWAPFLGRLVDMTCARDQDAAELGRQSQERARSPRRAARKPWRVRWKETGTVKLTGSHATFNNGGVGSNIQAK